MKKIFLTLLVLVPFFVKGQSIYDVYNLSASYYQGTAKSMAMGNAMGAVGQDFSSISINPAGLGLFRKPTFTFTPSINTLFTESYANGGKPGSDSKANLSINNKKPSTKLKVYSKFMLLMDMAETKEEKMKN